MLLSYSLTPALFLPLFVRLRTSRVLVADKPWNKWQWVFIGSPIFHDSLVCEWLHSITDFFSCSGHG